ncbi:unnamed protein product [Phytomonas sp. EM1]|nr:unnamed protein product [Phytomonas sp. EM1]|eukprot:CCW64322.1 unnamed protein product [Phytomonas sp. isolate EM1]
MNYETDSESDNYDEVYDDVADDWEEEIEEEEKRKKLVEATKTILTEKRQIIRAPTVAKLEEEKDLPNNIQLEIERMQREAMDMSSASELLSDKTVDYIADHPVKTKHDAEELGALIANHILTFSHNDNFPEMTQNVYKALVKDFIDLQTVNDKIAQINLTREELRRAQKGVKKAVT